MRISQVQQEQGAELEAVIERLLADPRVSYLQAHYAQCSRYAARIERVQP